MTLRLSKRACHGVSLIECLAYIAVFVLITGLAYAAYFQCLDAFRDLNRKAGQITKALHAGETWRQDVRACIHSPRIESADGGLALHLPQKQGEVIYLYLQSAVYRKADTNASPILLLDQIRQTTFAPETRGQVAVWTWEIELATKAKTVRLKPLLTFQAVAGPVQP